MACANKNALANQCNYYKEGGNICIDVEKEKLDDLTTEEKQKLTSFKMVCLIMGKPYQLPS